MGSTKIDAMASFETYRAGAEKGWVKGSLIVDLAIHWSCGRHVARELCERLSQYGTFIPSCVTASPQRPLTATALMWGAVKRGP